jgi:hypothetical protein
VVYLEPEDTLPHTVTIPVSQTIPGTQIQVDIVSSPSAGITDEFEEAPSTSEYHEVRKLNFYLL